MYISRISNQFIGTFNDSMAEHVEMIKTLLYGTTVRCLEVDDGYADVTGPSDIRFW